MRVRRRAHFDFGRLREALAAPGIDARTWIVNARIDDDPDAIWFVPGYGWVADVTFTSGQIGGMGPIPCRIMSAIGAPSEATIMPTTPGAEVVVAIPDGSVLVQPVIIGYLHNPNNLPTPQTVNGEAIDQDYAEETMIVAAPSKSIDVQVGERLRLAADSVAGKGSLLGKNVDLAQDGATQPFVRGTDLQAALANLSTALNVYAGALGAPGTPGAPVLQTVAASAAATLATALTAFGNAITTSLSQRIKGE